MPAPQSAAEVILDQARGRKSSQLCADLQTCGARRRRQAGPTMPSAQTRRGSTPARDRPWCDEGIRQQRPRTHTALPEPREGQAGLSAAFDLPTQLGYDADHPLARREAVKGGHARLPVSTTRGRCSTRPTGSEPLAVTLPKGPRVQAVQLPAWKLGGVGRGPGRERSLAGA
ncbi:MAG: methylmalonyl-CoA mutase family protein [Egibacteraceae bacterium]